MTASQVGPTIVIKRTAPNVVQHMSGALMVRMRVVDVLIDGVHRCVGLKPCCEGRQRPRNTATLRCTWGLIAVRWQLQLAVG